MELKDQVCSLELAKKLKELNCRQESLWWWNWNCASAKWILFNENMSLKEQYPYEESISAFTCAELGQLITCTFHYVKMETNIHNVIIPHQVFICDDRIPKQTANTEANARAKMWLYLKKEGLL